VNAREWIDAYAERLGVPAPGTEDFKALLELAGVAAHSSERVAAPISCWVAARAGLTTAQALEAARALEDPDSGGPA
jgi:hypothetical protein